MFVFYIVVFIISCLLLFWVGNFLVEALMRMARFLGWKEFVVAFFVVAFAASIPELLIGISSALHKIPELSFGNIVGANIIHFSLAVALCVLILKGSMTVESRTVQAGSAFAVLAAILPLLLILDGTLGRIDAIILILAFVFYVSWLFSKRERFVKIYDEIQGKQKRPVKQFKVFLKDLGLLFGGIIVLLISAEGIIRSAGFFAQALNIPLALVGILIVGAGTALPETYFCLQVATRRGQSWMILGNLMGCTAVTATLVLGIVALIHPIAIPDFSPFAIARFFLIISAVFFFLFARTGQKITKKEALFLLGLYILFVLVEILAK